MVARRRIRQWRQRAGLAFDLSILIAAIGTTPAGMFLHRLGIDILLLARHAAFGPLFPPERSEAVVVVIDEGTYRTPSFS